MRTSQDIAVFLTMQRHGGSFARALGAAAELADDNNLARLKAAFPELLDEYAALSELAAQQKERA